MYRCQVRGRTIVQLPYLLHQIWSVRKFDYRLVSPPTEQHVDIEHDGLQGNTEEKSLVAPTRT